jgi:hypothetical protein
MAAKKGAKTSPGQRRIVKRVSFVFLQKLAASVCLLALVVMLTAGILAGVPVVTIAFRACIAMLAVKVITRVLVIVLSSYEEIDRGEA